MQILISDLKLAEKIVLKYSGGYSGTHLSVEEFHRDLRERILMLEQGEKDAIDDLWGWFAPTCQWDDFTKNIELGEKIFQQLSKLKK